MQYAEFALAWESRRLGDKRALHRIEFGMEDALSAYSILFPDKTDTITETNAILRVAQELETPIQILRELITDSVSQLLSSESSETNQSNFSLDEVLRLRKATLENFAFISLTKQLSEPEARLFWSTLIRERSIITRGGFLSLVGAQLNIKAEVVRASRSYLSDEDLIASMYEEPDRLFNPSEWYSSPRVALRKRPLYPWNKQRVTGLDEYNNALYQEIPLSGMTEILMLEDKHVIIERTKNGTIIDAIFPDEPELNLQDRLAKYQSANDVEIAWPVPIPSWHALMKIDEGHSVRFPNTKPFDPAEEAGYMLIRSQHIHNLRLDSYKLESGVMTLKLQALDGLDDYVDACVCPVYEPSEQTSITFLLERLIEDKSSKETKWIDIPLEQCVVISVSSPFIDRETNMLTSPSYMGLRDGMGMDNVTQYVDLLGG